MCVVERSRRAAAFCELKNRVSQAELEAACEPKKLTAKRKMILTTCAACAAPLAHNAPRCVRCHTRYCNKTCQHDHWRRGHKQMCKKIHRGGNAEQYNADKKYKEAVAVAVYSIHLKPGAWN